MKVTKRMFFRFISGPAAFLLVLALVSLACAPLGLGGSYHETFDSLGSWGSGNDADVEGNVNNGRYELFVKAESGIFWTTAGQNFEDGVYEVEATQVGGTLDNGYGLMFRVDNDTDSFYLLEVSGDGYVWIGRCADACAQTEALLNDGWFESTAVNQGLNTTNHLRVHAEGANMIFFVNSQEVGRITDSTLRQGDVGLTVETLGEGGVRVAFDNVKVTPLTQE